MQTTIRIAGDVGVLHFVGDFDGGTECAKTTQRFQELMAQGVRKFVLDFTLVRWINSNGVGCLGAGKRMADAAGARMALCHLNRRSLNVICTMRLEEVFPCVSDLEAALVALADAGPKPEAGDDAARKPSVGQPPRDQF
jgi:anti-anti-sigma factor